MTREEKLYSMKMQDLVKIADKLGININTKTAKSKAVEVILAAEEMNKHNEKESEKEEKEMKKVVDENMCADGRSYAEIGKEIAEQAKSKLVPMPGAEKLAELKEEYCSDSKSLPNKNIDQILLNKFTKKEQRIITSIYRDGSCYHVTAEKDGNITKFDDKSLLRIGLAIRAIVKGE